MTREEEIEKILDDEFDTDLYDYITDNSYCNYCAGFRQGVEWADNHPINVWHDASEEPQIGEHVLAIDYNGEPRSGKYKAINGGIFDFNYINGIFLSDELVFVWDSVIRWAYIDDLLPKGSK